MTDFAEQYKRVRKDYEELTKEVSRIVKDLAGEDPPVVLSHISSRTKEPDGVKEKIERKGYTNPEVQMEDLAAVRAIVYRKWTLRNWTVASRCTLILQAAMTRRRSGPIADICP